MVGFCVSFNLIIPISSDTILLVSYFNGEVFVVHIKVIGQIFIPRISGLSEASSYTETESGGGVGSTDDGGGS